MPNNQHHYPTVTLLRGVAALMVGVFHFTSYSDQFGSLFMEDSWVYKIGILGSHGVTLFFVISGFVIPLSLSRSHFTRKEIWGYFKRRAIRIEIPYLVSILCVLAVMYYYSCKSNTDFQFNPIQFLFHLLHLIPFSNYEWYNIIYWTLSIEFQFYIITAFLMYFWVKKKMTVLYTCIVLFMLSSFIPQDIYFITKHAGVFGLGLLLFLIKSQTIPKNLGYLWASILVLSIAWVFKIEVALVGLIGFLCIQFWEYKSTISAFFGNISYSLYLTHGLIGGTLLSRLHTKVESLSMKLVLVFLALLCSISVAVLFWKIIENPSKKWAKKSAV